MKLSENSKFFFGITLLGGRASLMAMGFDILNIFIICFLLAVSYLIYCVTMVSPLIYKQRAVRAPNGHISSSQ